MRQRKNKGEKQNEAEQLNSIAQARSLTPGGNEASTEEKRKSQWSGGFFASQQRSLRFEVTKSNGSSAAVE
jgi:hypothetical protein